MPAWRDNPRGDDGVDLGMEAARLIRRRVAPRRRRERWLLGRCGEWGVGSRARYGPLTVERVVEVGSGVRRGALTIERTRRGVARDDAARWSSGRWLKSRLDWVHAVGVSSTTTLPKS
jgi:hypothetical protein